MILGLRGCEAASNSSQMYYGLWLDEEMDNLIIGLSFCKLRFHDLCHEAWNGILVKGATSLVTAGLDEFGWTFWKCLHSC